MLGLNRVADGLRHGVAAFLDFVYPPYCLLCDAHLAAGERLICEKCWQHMPRISQQEGHRHGAIEAVRSLWPFSAEVQTAIHELKFHGKRSLATRIGAEIARRLFQTEPLLHGELLVPVPLHKTRLRERGYNQSALLAHAISHETGIPVDESALKRVRYTRQQAKLGASERMANVRGAFRTTAGSLLAGKNVVLVDDVFTTGSTLEACAETLKTAGVKRVFAVTAAQAI
ncbi:MAG: ComF family protein [Calditrichaeota bacterium]|nr:MAG: ComF family protein [Calditrichota bacterium]